MHKVFVYGSLLSGMGNHHIVEKSKCLGITRSPKGFSMLDLGSFPGVVEGEVGDVIGEVYEVDDITFARLDRLEGYNPFNPTHGLYNRRSINTEFGEAFIYVYNNHYGRGISPVENGDWRTHYQTKFRR
jgi:gamma-glutamylaminecyclotransferase